MMNILIKRVYEPATTDDGYRVLVDRLWPRGVSKEHAALDKWMKDIAPSPDLRTWWNHDPARMDDFAARYEAELDKNRASVQHLFEAAQAHDPVTLIYAAHDSAVNHAIVLQHFMHARLTDSTS